MDTRLIAYGFLSACLLWTDAVSSGTKTSSVYTPLSGKKCLYIERDTETGSSAKKCPGVSGYHLLVLEDDDRMSITVVSPDGNEHPLNFWEVVTPTFSHLGKNAEWLVIKRHKKRLPIALIVRVNSFYQENLKEPVVKSYLSVSKITPQEICVTEIINDGKNANQKAREAADNANKKACIKH